MKAVSAVGTSFALTFLVNTAYSFRVAPAWGLTELHKRQSTTIEGTQADGPSGQGTCSSTGTDTWLCDNGAFCTWNTDAFSCVGASSSGSGSAGSSDGPPGRECTAHIGHWDCEDGSLCELDEATSVWTCEVFSSSSGEGGSSGSTCVVHGGHTHGDCSGQCNGIDLGEYDQGLHIGSVFILLVASALGIFIPIFTSQWSATPLFRNVFFIAKHFGTGVIISTAFVHLLYHAFIMFSNACLGELVFEPVASAIAMAGVYVVFFIDFFGMRYMKGRAEKHAAAHAHATSDGSSDGHDGLEKGASAVAPGGIDFAHNHHGGVNEAMDYSSKQAHFDVLLLEAGIIFHSIMIGVSLGATGGSEWIPLLCAITFHQFFEALGLGARIGLLIFPKGQLWKKWLMGACFIFITPIGIAIGIGVHSSYNPNSGAALLSIGILDSISAGILLYAGIVELLVHDFMHGELATAKWRKLAFAGLSLFLGTFCMTLLGKWA